MRLKKLQWFATSNAASDSQLDLNHNGHQPCRQNRRSEARGSNLSVQSGHGANDNGVSVHPLAPCTCGRRVPMRSGQVNSSKNQRYPAAPTLHLRLPARASITGTGTGKLSPAKHLPIVCLPPKLIKRAKMRRSHSLPIHHEFVKHSLAQDSSLHCVGSTSTSGLLARGKHEKTRRWMMSSDVANFAR
jgi:hypothetical protein